MSFLVSIRRSVGDFVPPAARSWFLRHFSVLEKRTLWWESKDPFRNDQPYSMYESPYPVKLGIVKEFWHRHINYIAACREMKIAYQLIDITANDWLEQFQKSDCDAYLIFPSVQMSQWKTMYDERLKIVVQTLKKKIFPGYDELWLYESKRRMAYWLEANGFPHAQTRIFYRRDEALKYAENCELPIVTKTNMGARASGVKVVRDRGQLRSYIVKAFKKGIIHGDGDPHDADWGYVILQKFIPCQYEWRIINIGPYFMGHQKLKKGDYCSGSDMVGWVRPPENVLNLVSDILERGQFQTADVDIFQGTDGKLYINEIQALFGAFRPYQMLDNGIPGYLKKNNEGKWIYHKSICCQNACCNMRVVALMEKLGCKIEMASLDDSVVQKKDINSSIESFQASIN